MAATGLEGARAAVGGVRPPPRCPAARALLLPAGGGHLDHEGDARHGEGDRLGDLPQERRGEDHDPGRREPPRRRGAASSRRSPTATCNVDTIIQNVSDVARRRRLLHRAARRARAWRSTRSRRMRGDLGYRELSSDDQIGKVTLVGAGMKSEPGVAAKMFRVLAERGDQPPDDRHEHHPHHGRHRPPRGRARGAGAARRVRPGERGRAPRGGEAVHRADV